jgi:hypothetical protein
MEQNGTKRSEGAGNGERKRGSCHCGAVKFEVTLDLKSGVSRCNCTICTKLGITGSIVKPAAFTLVSGDEAAMGMYEWGAKVGKRFFCKTCGVHVYGRGHLEQLGGDYVSINANCLDDVDVNTLSTVYWDGRHNNWAAGPRPSPWPIFA